MRCNAKFEVKETSVELCSSLGGSCHSPPNGQTIKGQTLWRLSCFQDEQESSISAVSFTIFTFSPERPSNTSWNISVINIYCSERLLQRTLIIYSYIIKDDSFDRVSWGGAGLLVGLMRAAVPGRRWALMWFKVFLQFCSEVPLSVCCYSSHSVLGTRGSTVGGDLAPKQTYMFWVVQTFSSK